TVWGKSPYPQRSSPRRSPPICMTWSPPGRGRGTTSKRCRSYWVSISRQSGRFCAVNCPPDGQPSSISCCWLPGCRSVSAAGGARAARRPAQTIRGDAGQPMWAREDVCELFAQNVSPFAENLGPRAVLFAANVGRIERRVWARRITFVGRYTYLFGTQFQPRPACSVHAVTLPYLIEVWS